MTTIHGLEGFFSANNAVPPLHLGTRYDSAGRFLPEAGNTVISHLDASAPSAAAVHALRERIRTLPGAGMLAFTALPSLHMTIFQGIIEHRRKQPFWPKDLPKETPVDDMTALFLQRLACFQPPSGRFEVAATEIRPTGLTVAPVDDQSAACLRQWRDSLAGIFGYRHPDHDCYRFHITFAYLTDWLPDTGLPEWQRKTTQWLEEFNAQCPTIAIEPPAFCTFDDMNHFEKLLVLN